MPSRYMEALLDFHGHPNSILDDRTNGIPLRRTLIEEESAELLEAIDEDDVQHIAREMADVLYVVFGTALVYGIDLDAAFDEVHRAAMRKMDAGLRREDGKIIKPPGFVPPDMTTACAHALGRENPQKGAGQGAGDLRRDERRERRGPKRGATMTTQRTCPVCEGRGHLLQPEAVDP